MNIQSLLRRGATRRRAARVDRAIFGGSVLAGIALSTYFALRPSPTIDHEKQANAAAHVDQFLLDASVDVLLRREDRKLTPLRSGQSVRHAETLFVTYENRLDHVVKLRLIEANQSDRLSVLREGDLLPGMPQRPLGEVKLHARVPGPMTLFVLLSERGELATLPLRATADELRAMCPRCSVRAIPLVAADSRD